MAKTQKLKAVKEPKLISLEYYKELKRLANELKRDVRELLIPAIKDTTLVTDSVSDILRIVNQLQIKYSNIIAFSQPVANRIVSSINRYNKNSFSKK